MTAEADPDQLVRRANEWADADPDPATAAAARDAAQRRDPAELADLFGGRLAFGTAGIRAPLGPGPNRLNRLVARQSAAGLARHLLDSDPGTPDAGVVVAHDARHGSEQFAADAVAVISAHGISVHALDGPCPTPLAAFAVRHLGAAAAVVVTASHNPPADNGIKVYWGDGAQIVPPHDAGIAAAIAAVDADGVIEPEGRSPGPVHHLGAADGDTELVRAYLSAAAELVPGPPRHPLPLAATSLHGVGAGLLELTLLSLGHGPLHHVASQRDPDPDFPTVTFPNPEEPGALDELLALAEETGAVLALANDPDADRLAVAARAPDGAWQPLTGDELGAVLAHHLLRITEGIPNRLLATTVVSSRLLSAMAADAGVRFAETLTGFKWLCRPALEDPDLNQVLAYEEALGYAVGPSRDKDGITAALVAADMACDLAERGATVWDVLDGLAVRHGAHVTRNGSVRLDGPGARARLAEVTGTVVTRPPGELGGVPVVRSDRPAEDVLRLWLRDDTRVVLRPSGTEPKFKYYCEAIEPVAASATSLEVDAARERARARLAAVVDDLGPLLGAG